MSRRRSKTAQKRDADLARAALRESQEELRMLIDAFDNEENPTGRTLSLLCSRIIEEMKILDPGQEISLPSLMSEKGGKYWEFVVWEIRSFSNETYVRFQPNGWADLISKYPLASVGIEMQRSRWLSQTIFTSVSKAASNRKKFSRKRVLQVVRNDLGAHFLEDMGKVYSDLTKDSAPPFFTNIHGMTAETEMCFEMPPHIMLVRGIAAELTMLLRKIFPSREQHKRLGDLLKKEPPSADPISNLRIRANDKPIEKVRKLLEQRTNNDLRPDNENE